MLNPKLKESLKKMGKRVGIIHQNRKALQSLGLNLLVVSSVNSCLSQSFLRGTKEMLCYYSQSWFQWPNYILTHMLLKTWKPIWPQGAGRKYSFQRMNEE